MYAKLDKLREDLKKAVLTACKQWQVTGNA